MKRFRIFIWLACSALALGGCTATGGSGSSISPDGQRTSGSGVTVYGTIDAGVQRSGR